MYSQIIEALNNLKKNINRETGKKILIDNYSPIELTKNNFTVLSKQKQNSIAFIDGGNAEILGASNFSLQLIRTYYSIYKDKRTDSKKNEFFIIVTSLSNIKQTVEYFPHQDLPSEFQEEDPRKVAELVRKLAEINLINNINADIIVRDGDLQSETDYEKEYYAKITKLVCGVAKTTRLFTEKGVPAPIALKKIAPSEAWLYHPVALGNPYVSFVKFHSNSNYIFRFEITDKTKIQETVETLAYHSRDPIFLGYPYGLIDADRHARVTNQEVSYFKMMLEAKAGKDFEKIRQFTNTLNAHDILDSQ